MSVNRFLILSLLFLFSALAADAQEAGTALRGRVTDVTGAALPGASVSLSARATGQERTVMADVTGAFAFAALREGSYRLTASIAGFASASRLLRVRDGNRRRTWAS